MICVKFDCEGLCRRRTIPYTDGLLYEHICVTGRMLFPVLSLKCFDLEYVDEDEDLITMSSEVEVLEAIRVMKKLEATFLRVKITNIRECPHDTSHVVVGKQVIQSYINVSQEHFATPNLPTNWTTSLKADCVGYRCFALNASCIYPLSEVVHIWRVRNVGSIRWPSGCVMSVRTSIDSRPTVKALSTIDPGEYVDVVMEILAPGTSGMHTGTGEIAYVSGGSSMLLMENIPVCVSVCAEESPVVLEGSSMITHRDCQLTLNMDQSSCLIRSVEKAEQAGASLSPSPSVATPHERFDRERPSSTSTFVSVCHDDDEDAYADEIFEDFPSIVLDASTGRLSTCSPTGGVENYFNIEHGGPHDLVDSGERGEIPVENDLNAARIVYQKQLAQQYVSIWHNEIDIIRSMGFRIDSEELQHLLEEKLCAPDSYDAEDLQKFAMYLLAHTTT